MIKKIIIVTIIALVACIAAVELFSGTKSGSVTFVFVLGWLACLICLGVTSLYAMMKRQVAGWISLGIAITASSVMILNFSPGGNRIIAPTVAPDGTQMCLTQAYTGYTGEPYRISFYYKKPGQPWGWFYYEHEDLRWWCGCIQLSSDGKQAVVKRFLLPVAYFDIPSESFTIVRWDRTMRPAQGWMPADWSPEQDLRQNDTLSRMHSSQNRQ